MEANKPILGGFEGKKCCIGTRMVDTRQCSDPMELSSQARKTWHTATQHAKLRGHKSHRNLIHSLTNEIKLLQNKNSEKLLSCVSKSGYEVLVMVSLCYHRRVAVVPPLRPFQPPQSPQTREKDWMKPESSSASERSTYEPRCANISSCREFWTWPGLHSPP